MLDARVVVAKEPGKVSLETIQIDEKTLPPDQVLVKTDYSAISAGTECAWISGNANNDAQKFPYYPGYSAVGHVVRIGSEVKNFAVGDRVIAPWGGHRSYIMSPSEPVWFGAHKIADDRISMLDAACVHIASFPMLGVRKLKIELGEPVMIAGLGILGQIALQAARYSGAMPLLACDFSPERRALALKMGADAVFDPQDPDFIEQVKAASGGRGVRAVVEVTGKAAALKQALKYTAKMGRISLLGCTRIPDCPIDFYRDVHQPGITLIGAHTSNRPMRESRPGEWTEHDDYDAILKFLAAGRFDFASLISQVVSPADCGTIYDTLLHTKNPPMGIVYDWSLLEEKKNG